MTAQPRVPGREGKAPARIALIEKNRGAYWDMVNAGALDAGRRLGVTVLADAPEYESLDEQLALVHRYLDEGVDGLAFVATSQTAFTDTVAAGRRRGVPIITMDLDAPDSGRLMYVGMLAPVEMGRQAGRLMLDALGERRKVAVQTGSADAHGATGKLAGFTEVMTAAGVEVVGGDNDGERLDAAERNAHRLLSEHPDIGGFFGVYGYHAPVQARAVEAAGRDDIAIIGFDMLPETVAAIEAGTVRASIWIREYYFGYYAVAALANLARLGDEETLTLLGLRTDDLTGNLLRPQPLVVDRDNVGQFRAWARGLDLESRIAATL
ncbi:sugar-binding protein [Rugosimonospora acidiphila]|uniref:Sugar-binding protein n=1 Tax=Rugosimonospora acidiphila TaxID=556531 RepID=A0ABP9RU43_9ACTN